MSNTTLTNPSKAPQPTDTLRPCHIPKPPPLREETPEEIVRNKSIAECTRKIEAYDPTELQISLVNALNNKTLDNESRRAIVDEIERGRKNLPDNIVTKDEENDWLTIKNSRELMMKTIVKPPELISGVLYQGGKMSYNADSKMGKTWSLLHLGISLSEGLDWFGFKTTKTRVLFINPEIQEFSFESRIQCLLNNMSGIFDFDNFDYLTIRGKQVCNLPLLSDLKSRIKRGQYGAIILDSIYKFYPHDTDENSSSDVGKFLKELESLARHTGAAIIYSHHFSKGNQAHKSAIDRSSGAGAWGRDPDTIVSVTQHEKEDCYTVEFNLRDFKKVEPIVIRVNWPNVSRDSTLNPAKLKTTQFTAKYDASSLLALMAIKPYTATELQKEVKSRLGMSSGTFYSLWDEIKKTPGVKEEDKKWFYQVSASNPQNN